MCLLSQGEFESTSQWCISTNNELINVIGRVINVIGRIINTSTRHSHTFPSLKKIKIKILRAIKAKIRIFEEAQSYVACDHGLAME